MWDVWNFTEILKFSEYTRKFKKITEIFSKSAKFWKSEHFWWSFEVCRCRKIEQDLNVPISPPKHSTLLYATTRLVKNHTFLILNCEELLVTMWTTSIEAVSFALRVSLEEAPKIRTVKSTACVSKKNKTFHRKAFFATFHTSTHLFDTCDVNGPANCQRST